MARILRHLFVTMKRIKTRTITTNSNENQQIRENWIRAFIKNNRQIMDNGILWNVILRENMFMTKPISTQECLQHNHQTIPKVYWTFSLKNIFGKLWKKKKGNDQTCETKKKKKKIKKPKCGKKNIKKKCAKTKETCLDPSKKKKKDKAEAKEVDPCKKVEDPCKTKEEKRADPCKDIKAKKEDPCKKKEAKKADPCKDVKSKKADPCKSKEAKKADPCKDIKVKKEDPCKKKEAKKADPCKDVKSKKADPCKTKEAKKADPCKDIKVKKEDPCKKKEAKKADPCKDIKKKKEDPCKKKEAKKADPCKDIKKKEDPCKTKEAKKADPCKDIKLKKEDPCKKKEAKKADPCKDINKKEDPCKKIETQKADPCKDINKKEDPCKKIETQKADPCKDKKAEKEDHCQKKADPCKEIKAKKEDNCKEIKSKKEDPCKNMMIKNEDPCNKIKANKKNSCKMKTDPGKEKDQCTKIIKSFGLKPFVVNTRGSDTCIKQFPITTFLTVNSAKSRRLVPSYTKLTVRGLKQFSRNSKSNYKNTNKKWRILSNKIINEKIKRSKINQTRMDMVSASCSSLKLIDQAKMRLNNCIVHISRLKMTRISETFNLAKRLDSLRSLIGCEDIKSGKLYPRALKSKIETTRQFLLSFGVQQRNEINNNYSYLPEKLPKLQERRDVCLLYAPNILQSLLKYLYLDKAENGNDLGRKIFSFEDKSQSDININAMPIIKEYWKQIISFNTGLESNSRTFKVLLKLDSYIRGFLDKNKAFPQIDTLKSKFGNERSHCCITDPKPGIYANLNNLNKRLLKIFLIERQKWPIDCSEGKLDISRFPNLSFKNEESHKELEYTKLRKQSTNIQAFVNNIPNLDCSNSVDLVFEKLGDHVYFSNSLGLLVYWPSKIENPCIQMDKIGYLQKIERSLYAGGVAMNILNPSINSNGIQFYIDLEKCHRRKHGKKRKLPTCYDPDVESPIDELFNQGETYWPFYNECHKRIKDPNTYPPGSDPNANNMLFGNI